MRLRISLYACEREPAALVREAGIRFGRWEPQPIADQVMLFDVEPDSLPDPLPAWAEVLDDATCWTAFRGR